MTLGDLFESSLVVTLILLVALMLTGAYRFRPSRVKALSRKQKLRQFLRYGGTRLPLAIGFGVSFFVLGAAALTLNTHRPPADRNPVITLPERSGRVAVNLRASDCEGSVQGVVTYTNRRPATAGTPRLYSDQNGRRLLDPGERAPGTGGPRTVHRARFTLSDPLARRGLLSCYLQLPVVNGAEDGYEIRLSTGKDMEVDALASVPAPHGYERGAWIWRCPAGTDCPAFASVSYAVEEGAKQVIVLVLAAVFGSLIALLAGEALIKMTRSRFGKDES